jgi:hypothetical protein
MNESTLNPFELLVALVTRSNGRKSLYHFTRMSNLLSMATSDSLCSAEKSLPLAVYQKRAAPVILSAHDQTITLNAHLRIVDSAIHPDLTQLEFFAFIDKHVFFCPTVREVQKFLANYSRREPKESFAILQFNARSLLLDHFNSIKLSKYDSGSSPRFPNQSTYKKSLEMFMPLMQFGTRQDRLVPVKSSEIHEILIEHEVVSITKHLEAVYTDLQETVPLSWKHLWKPLSEI